MEKHANVTIDFNDYRIGQKNLRIPLHMKTKDLIEELCIIYNSEHIHKELEYQSFKATISEQFISGMQTLLEANIKDGEILVLIR